MIGRAVAEVRSTHPEVEWKLDLASPLPAVVLADDEFEEVLLILLRNAIEAMPGGGRAFLSAATSGGEIHVCVEDGGKGVAAADLEKIFRAGYTTKLRGSGYGLFLARRILSGCGGALRGRPGEGGGAVFEVRLPISSDTLGEGVDP